MQLAKRSSVSDSEKRAALRIRPARGRGQKKNQFCNIITPLRIRQARGRGRETRSEIITPRRIRPAQGRGRNLNFFWTDLLVPRVLMGKRARQATLIRSRQRAS